MKFYKDSLNVIFAFESDGSQDAYIDQEMTAITEDERDAILLLNFVPTYSCNPWQIRKVLNQLGLRQAVEDAVALSADQTMKDGWEFATEFRSDDPFVQSMGSALGKTQAEIEQLIHLASTL